MRRLRRQRGAVYVLVLVTSSITVSMGILAVFASASQREVHELAIQRARAERWSESALEIALNKLESDGAFRFTASGGVVAKGTHPHGEYQVVATDDNGDVADDAADGFTLTATASYGAAKQRIAADFEIRTEPIEALEHTIVAARGVTSVGRLRVRIGETRVTVATPLLNSLLPVGGTVELDTIQLPDPSVVAEYAGRAAKIPVAMSRGGGIMYDDVLLTAEAAESAYGTTAVNADGIYVIDGGGGPVLLERPRIVGTLVVLNATSLELADVRTLRPGKEGYPVVLTDAPLTIDRASSSETETVVRDSDDDPEGPDFDPADFDGVQGLLYSTQDVTLANGLDLHGTLMSAGQIFITGDVSITRNDAFLIAPPAGFREMAGLQIVAGSWRAVID